MIVKMRGCYAKFYRLSRATTILKLLELLSGIVAGYLCCPLTTASTVTAASVELVDPNVDFGAVADEPDR